MRQDHNLHGGLNHEVQECRSPDRVSSQLEEILIGEIRQGAAEAKGKLITIARRTDARAMGQGIDTNSTRWTLTNGNIDTMAARQNVLPTRM